MEGTKKVNLELESNTPWTDTLKNKLKALQVGATWLPGQKPTIRRVYSRFRNQEPEAYEPKLVSIGPFHHRKSNLLPMEEIKLDNLCFIHEEISEEKFEILVDEIYGCLHQARDQYLEDIDMSDDEFAEMLMKDSCFIVGLCLNFDPIRTAAYHAEVREGNLLWRDIMLLENQIPFFVVNRIYKTIVTVWKDISLPLPKDDYPDFVSLLFNILGINIPRERHPKEEDLLHILHLKHLALDPCRIPDEPHRRFYGLEKIFHTCTTDYIRFPVMIPSAKELCEAGIKLRRIKTPKEYNNNFHLKVSFRAGMLEIPWLPVNNFRVHELRNLIAFEQCTICHDIPHHVGNYCLFLRNLINKPHDVSILEANAILRHVLDHESQVVEVLDSLCKYVICDFEGHNSYIEIYKEVVLFCTDSRQRWLQNFMHNHFRDAGTIFLVMAVVLMVIFTTTPSTSNPCCDISL